jgi:hypothetical protein
MPLYVCSLVVHLLIVHSGNGSHYRLLVLQYLPQRSCLPGPIPTEVTGTAAARDYLIINIDKGISIFNSAVPGENGVCAVSAPLLT